MAETRELPDVAGLEQVAVLLRESVAGRLELLDGAGPEDRGAAAASLELAAAIGRVERVAHGLHLQALAVADRVKAVRGGIGPWLAACEGYATGHARALAQDARLLASVPDLTPHLSAGELTPDATRLLARTVKACQDTGLDAAAQTSEILHVVQRDGVSAAAGDVRVVEHLLDPDKAKSEYERHRKRSTAGCARLENGLWRFEVLLDPARAAVLRTALDALSAHWMRVNGRDGVKILPEDVKSTGQITAHAFYHLAKVFLNAPALIREAAFTPPVIFTAPLPDTGPETEPPGAAGQNPAPQPTTTTTAMATAVAAMQNPAPGIAVAAAATGALRDPVPRVAGAGAGSVRDPAPQDTPARAVRTGLGLGSTIPSGCAVSAYGDIVPLDAAIGGTPHDRASCRILHYDRDHRPVLLDGRVIDQDPHTRLATPAQRTALAIRDRECVYAGCGRPFAWSLEAHHLTPYSAGGPTILANLTSLCTGHHHTVHHPDTPTP